MLKDFLYAEIKVFNFLDNNRTNLSPVQTKNDL